MRLLIRRWKIVLLCVFVAVLLFHRSLLTLSAQPIVIEQPVDEADYVLVVDGENRFGATLAMLDAHPRLRGVLLIEDRHTTLVETGVNLRRDQIDRREFVNRGVIPRKIATIPGEAWNDWDKAAAIHSFLGKGDSQIVVMIDQFRTRTFRYILDCELGPLSQRVRIKGLVDARSNMQNWWRSRGGIKSLFGAYVHLAHAVLVGKPADNDEVKWKPASLSEWMDTRRGTFEL